MREKLFSFIYIYIYIYGDIKKNIYILLSHFSSNFKKTQKKLSDIRDNTIFFFFLNIRLSIQQEGKLGGNQSGMLLS